VWRPGATDNKLISIKPRHGVCSQKKLGIEDRTSSILNPQFNNSVYDAAMNPDEPQPIPDTGKAPIPEAAWGGRP
jgi:hypothetical protein